jgi:hypothetical protein
MVNKARGEAALAAGGREYRMLLTLGALAEIEDGLGRDTLSGVAARLSRARAADLAIVAAALLRGGGHEVCPADVLRLPCDLGVLMRAVTETFDSAGLKSIGAEAQSGPFPGTRGLRSD